ncbi:lipopolysaccharide 1,6-galactosyltransferase [Tatumella terrea]|uniref:glycosyltransferase n=1 Tax=Tatumella terrea TaxID=419007 RepID=UPI0031D6A637
MGNKRLLIVTSYISGNGGIERVIQKMDSILKDKLSDKLVCEILSLSGGDCVEKARKCWISGTGNEKWLNGLNSTRVPLVSKFKIVTLFMHSVALLFKILFGGYSYVLCTGPFQVYLLKRIKEIFRKKYIIYAWPHFSLDAGHGKNELIKHADYFLAISKDIIPQFSDLGVNENRIIYFPNPFYDFSNEIENYKKTTNDSVNLVYIGRLLFEGQKRVKDLLEAISKTINPVKLTIIGDGQDYNKIVDYIKGKKLENNVKIMKGWHDNPWEKVENVDFLILTSAYEGLPTVLGEALSRGIKVITSDCKTGPRDFVTPENGYIYPVSDISALSKIIDSCYQSGDYDRYSISKTMSEFYPDSYVHRICEMLKL